ncbi:MAG: 30S ribosomal protein S20 [Proteobacteria bacterium]|nr:30S ribosomal protein S20 [Pseudomonadota bacterium]
MATHQSAIKRARQNVKRRLRNRTLRSGYRTDIKKFIALITDNQLEEAQKGLPLIHKTIDKAHIKGLIKKNTASRKKSRITTLLNKAVGQV